MANTVVNGLASLMTGNPPQPGELLMGNITSPGPDAGRSRRSPSSTGTSD